ncbi:type I 3-dehydroquinate dehydratase [Acidaminobacter hydrogenoformans]|uniref:3-dehydroquinate dehydratase n=1 Tax=Acidaminobacter hydrogenoformans DSM 2784 TaxID=1120920 RepID=A0A1G5S5Q3_9FIRM|nr:type I 3-dehydroquinate dehydratase [Acidaminobacter hydrogenoformans]SCZ81061.1 3-dehydroquinate dehydratase [Acidaminobacter hydrogenoformans DSM 2784]
MSKVIKVKGICIGEGAPKIIVPIVERTKEAIIQKAIALKNHPMDVVEWRVDFYDEVFNAAKVLEALQALRQVLEETPILFTFRTKKEGGEREISLENYAALNLTASQSGLIELIDVEIFSGDAFVLTLIENLHKTGVVIIGSNHDFFKTPCKEELLSRLRKMQDMGADIPKIAVMPETMSDVITLLDATREMSERYADRPIITMSMSSKGVISRIAGEFFGSAMTFGTVGQGSAPGQIPASQLSESINMLHNAI